MILQIVSTTIWVLSILIFIRAIISWIPNIIDPRGPIADFLNTVTEPVLAPIRAVMPKGMMMDFTPMIAIFILMAIGRVINSS